MCSRQHRRKAAGFESRSTLHPACARRDDLLSSFSVLTAGKDLLRRRVNTVAMRKSVTHDSRDRPAIRSIGVVVTPLPSKQVSPVRVRYAAPHGLYLGVVESPSFKLTAGKDLPAGRKPRRLYGAAGCIHGLSGTPSPSLCSGNRQFESVWRHQRLQKSWHLS